MQPIPIDMTHLKTGFHAPVLDAQSSFRAILIALSFPGRVLDIPAPLEAPDGWPSALAAAALTLLDADTPVYLDAAARNASAEAFIRFHAGAPIVDAPRDAQFAILLDLDGADFDAFRIGEDQYPDRSATLLCAVADFTSGTRMRLTGPGVKTVQDIAPNGLGAAFWKAWARNQALYPLGYDVVFAAGSAVVGLPRTVAAEPVKE
jgi:alpha-D-ribose 1-methylphosphonate 5-triphosphate synthase subunit PhnH